MSVSQCAYWFLTIHEQAECYSTIKDILTQLEQENPNIEYSYIYHDIDDDDDAKHLHLVLYFKGKVKRFTTIFNLFKGAHIEQTNKQRYIRCIQYLIHKNDITKKQYNKSMIISNISKPQLYDYIDSNGYEYELFIDYKIYDYINEFYQKYNNVDISMFINKFGLGGIKQYYFIIKDIIKDFNETIYKNDFKKDKLYQSFCNDIDLIQLKKEYNMAIYYNLIPSELDFDMYVNEQYSNYVDAYNKAQNKNDAL